jgi:hypothetical protein
MGRAKVKKKEESGRKCDEFEQKIALNMRESSLLLVDCVLEKEMKGSELETGQDKRG